MIAPLVFMDTETTGLALDDDIWEFAAIRREPDGTQSDLHLFIEHDRKKCARLPESFREDHENRYLDHRALPPARAAYAIKNFIGDDKPHIVGAVPNFDTERTERIARLMLTVGELPNWHYHLIDIENLAVGYLAGTVRAGGIRGITGPPWESDEVSKAVRVEPDLFARHTAMGDVLWAQAIYDAVMGRPS